MRWPSCVAAAPAATTALFARRHARRLAKAVLQWLKALRARAALGPDAILTEAPEGGLVAESGSRRLDLTLPTLADAALEAAADQVAGLWGET